MERLDFTLIGRRPSGDSVRLDFKKAGHSQVSFNVGPLGVLRPQAVQAGGVVYLRW